MSNHHHVFILSLIFTLVLGTVACGDDSANHGSGDTILSNIDSADGMVSDASSGDTDTTAGGDAADTQSDQMDTQSMQSDSTDGGEGVDTIDPPGPPDDTLPIGIPTPSFGYELNSAIDATIYVDNTNSNCDNTVGTAASPLCDLFRGGASTSYEAGDVVHILGGPYDISGDYTLTMNGTSDAPVIIRGQGETRMLFDGGGQRANFRWEGSYGVIENIDFFHRTRHIIAGDHLALRDIAVHNPEDAFIDFNPVVSVTGHDVLIRQSEIGHNRRENDTDSHGVQASAGSYNVWILHNEIYNNNGDSFQGCHECFGAPPHHIYIGGNVMHDDRENAVDLKTIHDVVISENVMYGYGSSGTSSGDAIVVGSNGYDEAINQGPRRVWVLNNTIRNSATGIRVEGSRDVWIMGNILDTLGRGVQIDAKTHHSITVASNTIRRITEDGINAWGCEPTSLHIANNIIDDVGDRHIDLIDCTAATVTIENNLFFDPDGELSVRVEMKQHNTIDSLEATNFASTTVAGDPMLNADWVPAQGSIAVDAGVSLDAIYNTFSSSFNAFIDEDIAGTSRPNGVAQDIGAIERP